MSTSGILAVASLLLSLALAWKALFTKNGNGNGYVRLREFADLSTRIAVLENELGHVKGIRSSKDDIDYSARRITDLERTVYTGDIINPRLKQPRL